MVGDRPAGVPDAVTDRATQVVGQGGTGSGGVETVGNLARSHRLIKAVLRVFGKTLRGDRVPINGIGTSLRSAPNVQARLEIGTSRTQRARVVADPVDDGR